MLMELSKEGSLYKKMKVEKKFSESKTGRLMWNVLTAMNHLHNQDPAVLHRDLKPENLLMFENDQVKITDFGWSAEFNDVRNTFCGTQEYLSPEMIKGTGHDEKLDIWTLGILIYELLHGKTPFFQRRKGVDIRSQRRFIEKCILEGRFECEESLHPSTKEAIVAMLQPDKEKRPTSKELMQFEFFRRAINPMKKSKSMVMIEKQENISMEEVHALRLKTAELVKKNQKLEKEKANLQSQLKKMDNSDLLEKVEKMNSIISELIESKKELASENIRKEEDLEFAAKEIRGLTQKVNNQNQIKTISEKGTHQLKQVNQYIFQKSKVLT